MGNNTIRRPGFLNQNLPCAPNPGKMFFAAEPKIVLQHIPPESGHSRWGRRLTGEFFFATFDQHQCRPDLNDFKMKGIHAE
jgi:hypothetical protein